MSSRSDVVDGLPTVEASFDFEATFRAQYARIARVIARVVHDPARSEELAVEVFLKFWRSPNAHGENAHGWLYKVAVRKALDELRRQTRRARNERLFGLNLSSLSGSVANPEQMHAANEEQGRVRLVLALMDCRQAEMLLLRGHDFSYDELAATLGLNPASIGTLLSRAQQAFRKEYIKRYGQE